jgi:hypothetical protein
MARREGDTELKHVLAEYVKRMRSDPPPAASDETIELMRTMAAKLEHLERSRDSLGEQLGMTTSPTGTFRKVDRGELDALMLRKELADAQKDRARVAEELTEAKTVIAKRDERVANLTWGLIFAAIVAVVTLLWKLLSKGA